MLDEEPQAKIIEKTIVADELKAFPMLLNYKKNHNLNDFKKLCIEIVEFCNQVYASTTSDTERQVYYNMVDKLRKP